MKKLVFLFLSLLAAGGIFQACDDSKTYAEMLEDEKNAVNKFIKDKRIQIISQDEFEKNDTVTDLIRNEYVALSDGVYMQIVDRGSAENKTDTFANNNEICVRYIEEDIMTRDTTCFNVFLEEWGDANQLYTNPAVFRYVAEGSYVYGTFIQMDYYWASYYQSTAVPAGWLLALPFVRNYAHVRLIVPSKVGHSSAQQYVNPYYYDIWNGQKGCKRRGSDCRGEEVRLPRVHNGAGERLSDGLRRLWRTSLRRRAPAHLHCPGHAEGRADCHSRRGNVLYRPGK